MHTTNTIRAQLNRFIYFAFLWNLQYFEIQNQNTIPNDWISNEPLHKFNLWNLYLTNEAHRTLSELQLIRPTKFRFKLLFSSQCFALPLIFVAFVQIPNETNHAHVLVFGYERKKKWYSLRYICSCTYTYAKRAKKTQKNRQQTLKTQYTIASVRTHSHSYRVFGRLLFEVFRIHCITHVYRVSYVTYLHNIVDRIESYTTTTTRLSHLNWLRMYLLFCSVRCVYFYHMLSLSGSRMSGSLAFTRMCFGILIRIYYIISSLCPSKMYYWVWIKWINTDLLRLYLTGGNNSIGLKSVKSKRCI